MSKRPSRKHLYAKPGRAKSRAAASRRPLTPRGRQSQVLAGVIACALLAGGGALARWRSEHAPGVPASTAPAAAAPRQLARPARDGFDDLPDNVRVRPAPAGYNASSGMLPPGALPPGVVLPGMPGMVAQQGGRTSEMGYGVYDGIRQRFTGKERDTETGLDYFGARYYSGTMGRFTSPDPLYLDMRRLSDPQQWNLYAYARNNPLKYVDPNGMDITVNGNATDEYLKRLQQDVSFQIQLNSQSSKVIIVNKDGQALGKKELDALGKGLKGGEKELFKAITDTKNHVTIETVQKDSGVFFGAFRGGGKNTVDASDLQALDSPQNAGGFSGGQAVGHETLEAYKASQGYGYDESHDYANKYFGGLGKPVGNGTPIFDAKGANLIGVTADFPVVGRSGVNARVTMQFVTPIPVQSLPKIKPGSQPFHVVGVEKKP